MHEMFDVIIVFCWAKGGLGAVFAAFYAHKGRLQTRLGGDIDAGANKDPARAASVAVFVSTKLIQFSDFGTLWRGAKSARVLSEHIKKAGAKAEYCSWQYPSLLRQEAQEGPHYCVWCCEHVNRRSRGRTGRTYAGRGRSLG